MWDFFSTLAWIGLIGIGGWYFRASIRALFDRVRKLPGGTGLDPPKPPLDLEAAVRADAPKGDVDPVVTDAVKDARAKHGSDGEALRSIVAAIVEYVLQQIYSSILGSHVRVMLEAQERRIIVPPSDARIHYDAAVRLEPAAFANYSYEQWYGALLSSGLVSDDEGMLDLTPMGHAFMRYMKRKNLPIPPH